MVKDRTLLKAKRMTLLERYESLRQTRPEKLEGMMCDRTHRRQKLFGEVVPDPVAIATHEKIENEISNKDSHKEEGPPFVHLRLQYVKKVKHSRYEASMLSNIIGQADNIMDAVTGDEDDSDYETLVEIENNSGFLGLGIMKDENAFTEPELRILVVKVCNVHKIPASGEKVQQGVVKFSLKSKDSKKEMEGKTSCKNANHKNRIGFCHVFNFRGHEIEKWYDKEITLTVKIYTRASKEGGYITLSPDGCKLGEVSDDIAGEYTTDINFWKEYLDKSTEDIISVYLPLQPTTFVGKTEPENDISEEQQIQPDSNRERKKKKKKEHLSLKSFFG